MDIQNATESEKSITRREFIRKVSVTTCAAATFPWIVRPEVLAASGTVNVLMWSDYLTPDSYNHSRIRLELMLTTHQLVRMKIFYSK